ncbi:MAG: UbiX family flavin prenyltransferase [Bacteroidia bacterium]|nr:UbiX family flavin prenyltransferase [Bacteroidia bacterium]MCC6769193.1 UbiX family flavin prenyltransferase [Bacteroidia bacterium]
MKLKIAIGITGASGAIYAKVLLDKLVHLHDQLEEVGIVLSSNAPDVWSYELGDGLIDKYPFKIYDRKDFFAPFASGSARYDAVIICPCSMGTMGRISAGISDDLITRAADVALKERRKLILVPRDTPYNLIHLRNMTAITEAGGIICPASPSFYSKPADFESLAATVIDRVLDLAGLHLKTFRWSE